MCIIKNILPQELALSHTVPHSVVSRVVRTVVQVLIHSNSNLHQFENNNGFVMLSALFSTFPDGICWG